MRNFPLICLSCWVIFAASGCTFDASALLERTPCELDVDCPGGACVEQRCFYGGTLTDDVVVVGDTGTPDAGFTPDGESDVSPTDSGPPLDATVCAPGIARCTGNVLQVCNGDGSELVETDCETSECDDLDGLGCTCARGACVARICERGETVCDEAGTGFLTCNAGGTDFGQGRACPTGTQCLQADGEAICTEGGCEPNVAQCSGSDLDTVQICNADGTGFAAIIPCAPNQFCADGVCTPDLCTPGQTQCVNSSTVSVCDARGVRYVSAPCDSNTYCNSAAGRCLPTVCEPGERRCTDSGAPEVCRADGSAFETLAVCTVSTVCAGGTCTPRVCEPDAVSCDSSTTLAICNAIGTGVSYVNCPTSQTCRNGVCSTSVCEPNALSCVGGTVQRCNASGSATSLVETCSFGCASGACLPARCGDGVVSPDRDEDCDDGNSVDCDGCRNDCTIDYVARASTSSRTTGANWTPGTSNLTVEGWFNVSSLGGALFGLHSTDGDAAYLRVSNGRPEFVFNVSTIGGANVLSSPTSIRGTGWHHLAGVRVGPRIAYLFVDGRPVDGAVAGGMDTSIDDTKIFFGGMTSLTSADFQASQLRIGAHARYTAPFAPPRDAAANTTSRIAGYALETGEGNLVDNLGGDARDMTVTALSWQPNTCFGSADTAVVCGDGERAPWEFCEPSVDANCTSTCQPELVCERSLAVDGGCIRAYPASRLWADNESLCVEFGGHLMTVNSGVRQANAVAVMNEFSMTTTWIGLNDRATEGNFNWVDGSPVNYTNWDTASGQPDNSTADNPAGEDCVLLVSSFGYRWNDSSCNVPLSALCYRPGPLAAP